MLTVTDRLPAFRVQAVVSTTPGEEFAAIAHDSFPGRWLVLFAWPMDFTFVCPTEIAAFGDQASAFAERKAQVLGMSTDSHFVHLAWRQHHPALRDLPFPMLADTRRELSAALGILHPVEGVAQRATFIIDPQGVIRFASVTDMNVGRNVDEVLRVLDALQSGALTPCQWRRGQPTIVPPGRH